MKKYYQVVESFKRNDDECIWYGGFIKKHANETYYQCLKSKDEGTKAIQFRVYELDDAKHNLNDAEELTNAIIECIGFDCIKEDKNYATR